MKLIKLIGCNTINSYKGVLTLSLRIVMYHRERTADCIGFGETSFDGNESADFMARIFEGEFLVTRSVG